MPLSATGSSSSASGVTLCLGQQPSADLRRQRRKPVTDELGGSGVAERKHLVHRHPATVEEAVLRRPGYGQEPDPAARQAAGNDAQHHGAGTIQSRQVIHHRQHRPLLRGLDQQRQHRVGQPQLIRR